MYKRQQPGSPPLAQYFPARNRLISGLADVVIIVEARERSGSLITADMALEQGKDVYALPGSVDSQLSRGCNRLIKQGAGIILSPEELLEELNICGNFVKNLTETKIILETEQNIVYSCLDLNPVSYTHLDLCCLIRLSKEKSCRKLPISTIRDLFQIPWHIFLIECRILLIVVNRLAVCSCNRCYIAVSYTHLYLITIFLPHSSQITSVTSSSILTLSNSFSATFTASSRSG